MLEGLKEESVGFLFNLQVEVQQPQPEGVSIDKGLRSPVGARPQDTPAENQAPPALRAKGITDQAPRAMNYSGPAEDGHAESHSDAQEYGGQQQSGTRRERRVAARTDSKGKRRR